jgi:hypothetical protein
MESSYLWDVADRAVGLDGQRDVWQMPTRRRWSCNTVVIIYELRDMVVEGEEIGLRISIS